jgi:hypothetical protein
MNSPFRFTCPRTPVGLPPRSELEQLRLIHQGKVYPPSARRIDLLASTQLKQRKEITEWIEFSHPNGIEILARLSRSQTAFSGIIKQVLPDFCAAESRAAAVFERESVEFDARKDDVAASLVQTEARFAALKDENARLLEEIDREKIFKESLQNELQKCQPTPVAAIQRDGAGLSRSRRPDLIDPVVFFTVERERLEATLEALEQRFAFLSRELVVLHSAFPKLSDE